MLIAHRIALDPTNKQRTHFARAAGTARFAWNWALAEWKAQHRARQVDPSLAAPSDVALRRKLNSLKRENFPWMFDVTKCAAQEAIIDLGMAFASFFRDVKKLKRERQFRHPRFKNKGDRDSFCAANEVGTFRCDGRRIKLPKIGWVRMREAVRFDGVLKRVTVSRDADRWFASVVVEAAEPEKIVPPREVVGVDVGITTLATLSNAPAIPGPRAHKAKLDRLRRLSRRLSKKQKKSKNRQKARRKLARLHVQIANIRRDASHKATCALTRTYRRIGIENLNVRGMAGNCHLARSIMDGGWHEFRRQLEYKAARTGAVIVVADRWFPSSKTCSCCGVVKDTLDLNDRTFWCEHCGFVCDRDLNAARNLEKYAESFPALKLADSSTNVVCGEGSADARRRPRVKLPSAKQKPDIKAA